MCIPAIGVYLASHNALLTREVNVDNLIWGRTENFRCESFTLRSQNQSGDDLRIRSAESKSKINGFLALSAMLVNNAHIPDIYMILVHLLLGIQTPCDTPLAVSPPLSFAK
ncbi:unnamed protein product [Dibothriocephalus latus]|uniref:Uncharacterized protein n=1 Tax=Dibothriocephalus latus TaxID=60516 RepID=A0A3P7NY02_DIBLA|nr:unnamed protein product [Dibothriocephalus latus]